MQIAIKFILSYDCFYRSLLLMRQLKQLRSTLRSRPSLSHCCSNCRRSTYQGWSVCDTSDNCRLLLWCSRAAIESFLRVRLTVVNSNQCMVSLKTCHQSPSQSGVVQCCQTVKVGWLH